MSYVSLLPRKKEPRTPIIKDSSDEEEAEERGEEEYDVYLIKELKP